MNLSLTTVLSLLSLAIGVVVFLVAVTMMGTPIGDIGMLSTAGIFVLLGVFGLLLARAEQNAQND